MRRLACTSFVIASAVACWSLPLQASGELIPSPDGTIVIDTSNQVVWLGDANLPASNRFGLPICNGATDANACVNASGSMTYQAAVLWVNAMNAASYLGRSNWQLPTTPLIDATCSFGGPQGGSFGFGCSGSALGWLYYDGLGLKSPNTAVPIPSNTVGLFTNFQPYLYWSQTDSSQTGNGRGSFSFNSGFQGSNTLPNFLYVLPVIPGKVPGAPPATGTGLELDCGGHCVYDPSANVTWLADANLAATKRLGLPACLGQGNPHICVNADGAMNWDSANQFVMNMNAYNNGAGYLGQRNWELPPVDAACDVSYDCDAAGAGNPFQHLFYVQLGLSRGTPVVAAPSIAVGPFANIQPYLYWSCQADTVQNACQTPGPEPGFAWSFSFGDGFEGTDVFQNDLYVTVYSVDPILPVTRPRTTHTLAPRK